MLLLRFGCFAFAFVFAFGCTLVVLLGGRGSLLLLRGRSGETAAIGTADGDAFALLLLEEAHGGGSVAFVVMSVQCARC